MRHMQRKDDAQRLIVRILHEHNSMVMRILNEDGNKKRVFNHINMFMKKEEIKNRGIQVLNESGDTVSDVQEVEKEVDRFMLCFVFLYAF